MSENTIEKGTTEKKIKRSKPSSQSDGGKKILKGIGIFFLVVCSALLGIWVATIFFSITTKIPVGKVITKPFLIFDYYLAYRDAPAKHIQKAFKIAFTVAGMITLLLPIFVILGMKKKQSLYGEAKFANMDDIRKMGMLSAEPTSILVGKKNGRFLCYNGNKFGLLGAPTRSGKGVGLVIPNLLNYQHNAVVLDIKGENFEITSGWRKKALKQDIFLFNPFSNKTHRWNPLDHISNDPAQQVTDIIQLSYMFYPDPPNSEKIFFPAQARALFLGIVGLLKSIDELPNGKKINCTLGEVLRFTGGNGMSIQEYITLVLTWCDTTNRNVPTAYRDKLLAFVNQSDETRSSILGTFTSPLDLWLSKYVDNATSATDFDFKQLRREKMSIYVHIPPKNLPEARVMLNIFYSQLIMSNLDVLPEQDKTLKYQVCLLMDEFTAAGSINIINKSIQYIAGYNLRLMLIIQNKSQLLSAYGRENADAIMGNIDATIIYTPADNPSTDAKEYSDMLGYHSGKGKSTSRQLAGKGGRSISESEQKRALMLPQELREMPLTNEIVLLRGQRPIYADKIEYYSDPNFIPRIRMPEPKIPEWNIHQFIKASESIELAIQSTEETKNIKPEWLSGLSEFLSSVEENKAELSIGEVADKFANAWENYQGGDKEQAREVMLNYLATYREEYPENGLPEIPSADTARAEMIEKYGYDISVWTDQAEYDVDLADDALLPPVMDLEPNEEEQLNGNTSEDGLNSFSGN